MLACELDDGLEDRSIYEIARYIDQSLETEPYDFELTCAEFGFEFTRLQVLMILAHLGASPKRTIEEVALISLQLVEKYFSDDWNGNSPLDDKKMQRSKDNPDFLISWFSPWAPAFWLSLLADGNDAIRLCADWTESWFTVGFPATDVDETLTAHVLISVASSFRTSPLAGREEMEAIVLKSRKKMPKLLLQAWVAARSDNQQEFESNLLLATQEFRRRQNKKEILTYLLPMPHAIVLAAARKIGMTLPQFPEEISCYLPTCESIGLKPPKLMTE